MATALSVNSPATFRGVVNVSAIKSFTAGWLLMASACTLQKGTVLESYDARLTPIFSLPMHVTLERSERQCRIIKHYYHGEGGYHPVKYPWTTSKRLSLEESSRLTNDLKHGDFWTPRVKDISIPVVDGTTLYVRATEGAKTKTIIQSGGFSPCLISFFKALDSL